MRGGWGRTDLVKYVVADRLAGYRPPMDLLARERRMAQRAINGQPPEGGGRLKAGRAPRERSERHAFEKRQRSPLCPDFYRISDKFKRNPGHNSDRKSMSFAQRMRERRACPYLQPSVSALASAFSLTPAFSLAPGLRRGNSPNKSDAPGRNRAAAATISQVPPNAKPKPAAYQR